MGVWAVVFGVAFSVTVLGTAGYRIALLWGAEADPTWLLPTLVLVAIRVERVGLGVAAAAILLVPATASASLVLRDYGSFDTPFESDTAARGVDQLFVATPALAARTLPAVEKARAGAPDLLAVQSSAVASVFAYPTGQEVLPIGRFTGTQPRPTLAELRSDIARGAFHPMLAFPSDDPRLVWIATHCRVLDGSTPPLRGYFCTPADATG